MKNLLLAFSIFIFLSFTDSSPILSKGPLAPRVSQQAVNVTGLPRPLTIGHRGSSGTLPEHTMRAYRQAIEDGADYIECDITLTRDLVPVCIHEVYLSRTTDVATREDFRVKYTNRSTPPDGTYKEDWYAVDFDLVELKQLKRIQAYDFRDQSSNGLYDIPTLKEFLTLAAEENDGKVGIYPELKDAEWTNDLPIMNGSRFEDIVLGVLAEFGYDSEDDLVYLQSFSEPTLEYLTTKTQLKLVMLIETDATNADLDRWKNLGVDGVGVWTAAVAPHYNDSNKGKEYKNWINGTSDLVERCHSRSLQVHVWTIRNEDRFQAWDFQQDVHQAIDFFLKLRVDGFFTDFPGTLSRYLDLLYADHPDQGGANSAGKSGISGNGFFLQMTFLLLGIFLISL